MTLRARSHVLPPLWVMTSGSRASKAEIEAPGLVAFWFFEQEPAPSPIDDIVARWPKHREETCEDRLEVGQWHSPGGLTTVEVRLASPGTPAKHRRRGPRALREVPREVGRIVEPERTGDRRDGLVAVEEHALGLEHDPLVDQRLRSDAGIGTGEAVDRAGRVPEAPRVRRDPPLRGEAVLDRVSQPEEVLGRLSWGWTGGVSRGHQLQQHGRQRPRHEGAAERVPHPGRHGRAMPQVRPGQIL